MLSSEHVCMRSSWVTGSRCKHVQTTTFRHSCRIDLRDAALADPWSAPYGAAGPEAWAWICWAAGSVAAGQW